MFDERGAVGERRKIHKKLQKLEDAIVALADVVPNGHLLTATSSVDLLLAARDEILRLRKAQEVTGPKPRTISAQERAKLIKKWRRYSRMSTDELLRVNVSGIVWTDSLLIDGIGLHKALNARVNNILERCAIETVGDLIDNYDRLPFTKGFGPACQQVVDATLRKFGFQRSGF